MDPEEVRMPGPDFHLDQLSPNPGSLPYILDKVVDRLPAVEDNRIDAHRVGLVSYPADFMPNIGPVEALPGLYLGTNFCSGGFGWSSSQVQCRPSGECIAHRPGWTPASISSSRGRNLVHSR